MFSISKKSPEVKDNAIVFQIILIVFSVVTGAFLLSPTILYFITGRTPLTEMPVNTFYYILRALFAISIIAASVVFTLFKNTSIIALPSFIGLITSIYPLIYKIIVYKEYKAFIEKFSMTADFTGYYINIGIYLLFMILCLVSLLYSLGLLPTNLIVLVFSALTTTAVIFITIDRAKSVEFDIFNIYDILCFAYASVAALLPALVATSTKRIKPRKEDKTNKTKSKYQPKRMKV